MTTAQDAKPFTTHADGISPSKEKVSSAVEALLADNQQTVEQIFIPHLYDNPDNPRDQVGDVTDLAQSILSVGILEPLLVATATAWQAADDRLPTLGAGDFVVIAGHRRLAAAALAKVHTVPCIVRDDLVGAAGEVAMLIENLHREDLTAIEEAKGFAQLRDKHSKTQQQIADMTGYNQSHVSKRLQLVKLPEDLQAKVGTSDLPIEDAVAIAKHADNDAVMKAIAKRPYWQSVEEAATAATRSVERAEQLTAGKASLKARQLKFIEESKVGYGVYSTSCEVSVLKAGGVDVKDHIHRDCHAVTIKVNYSGAVSEVEVCTNPKGHPDNPAAKQQAEQAKTAQSREREAKAKEKRNAARLAVIKSALAKIDAGTTDVVDTLIFRTYLAEEYVDLDTGVSEDIAGVLDVKAAPAGEGEERDLYDELEALRTAVETYADQNATNRKRAVAAIALCLAANGAEASYGDRVARKAFLEWLQARGYKLTGEEAKRLKEASA